MRVALFAVAMVVAAACNGGSSGPGDGDAPPNGDPSTLTCAEISQALRARVIAVSHACTTVNDCAVVGYATRDNIFPTCDCAAAFGVSCSGDGVNAAAWAGDSRAQELLDEWGTRCVPDACRTSPNYCVCDCGRGELSCSPNGVCVVGPYDCFNPGGGDAAVD